MNALIDALERDLEAISAKRFISVMEAALIADSHPETVRGALRSGELHGSQRAKGGTWKVRPACVDAWVAGEDCEHVTGRQLVDLRDYRLRASGGAR